MSRKTDGTGADGTTFRNSTAAVEMGCAAAQQIAPWRRQKWHGFEQEKMVSWPPEIKDGWSSQNHDLAGKMIMKAANNGVFTHKFVSNYSKAFNYIKSIQTL